MQTRELIAAKHGEKTCLLDRVNEVTRELARLDRIIKASGVTEHALPPPPHGGKTESVSSSLSLSSALINQHTSSTHESMPLSPTTCPIPHAPAAYESQNKPQKKRYGVMSREAVKAQEAIYLESEIDFLDSVGHQSNEDDAIRKANAAYGY
ncbi:hypothetical protein SeMB42_g07769 [Synchytrium endobioticum]|uniref:Uncharacterized protein n=1 Tax=Synchytrium endobioticum TaxID=286115 RepID=A0A507BWY4_9FUNG|nr:hypothetical protein SeMB42_g07769 [Synchytrium endobioticum]